MQQGAVLVAQQRWLAGQCSLGRDGQLQPLPEGSDPAVQQVAPVPVQVDVITLRADVPVGHKVVTAGVEVLGRISRQQAVQALALYAQRRMVVLHR